MQQVSVSISGNDHQSLKCFDDQEICIPNKFLLNNKKLENFQNFETQIANFPNLQNSKFWIFLSQVLILIPRNDQLSRDLLKWFDDQEDLYSYK